MGNKLYVGNLPYSIRDNDLQQLFAQHGNVSSAKVMMERETGRSKGFGFVEMGSDAEAQAAIQGVHGTNFGGRDLVVNEARPMEPRAPRSGGFGGGSGGGGGMGGSWCAFTGFGHHPADAANVFDAVGTELFAQGMNQIINGAAFHFFTPAIHFVFQLGARQNNARTQHQRLQNGKFTAG